MNILTRIRGSLEARNEALTDLVNNSKLRSNVISFVMKNSGTEEEGIMTLHDAIVQFAKKVILNLDFTLESEPIAYITGMSKYLWYDTLKSRREDLSINNIENFDFEDHEINQDQLIIKSEKVKILEKLLDMMQANCKEIIMFWASKYSMQEIADKLGYKTEAVVRKKKSECMKNLINFLDANPVYKNELS